MLHNVAPETGYDFEPNRILRITPEFLERVIGFVISLSSYPFALDGVPARLTVGKDAKPFVVFTFDDGYRDNRDSAYQILRKYNIPMAIYVPSNFADGKNDLLWLALEIALRRSPSVDIELGCDRLHFSSRTNEEKARAFHQIYWTLQAHSEDMARTVVTTLCDRCGFEPSALNRELIMDWYEISQLAANSLVSIGAHTTGHYALSKFDTVATRRQIAVNIARIEAKLDRPSHNCSFPYGDKLACGPREF